MTVMRLTQRLHSPQHTAHSSRRVMSSPPNHASLLTHLRHPGQTFLFGGRSILLVFYQLNDTFVSGSELQQYNVFRVYCDMSIGGCHADLPY